MAYRTKYNDNFKKRKHSYKLEANLAGFLCTCNSKLREKDCVRESYNLLNEFADQIFGPEVPKNETQCQEVPTTGAVENDNDDIDAALAREVQELKAESRKKPDARRFQVMESGANGVVFIRTNVPDPVKLAHTILSRLFETKQQKSKFLLRLLPVEVTCKAKIDEICNTCDNLFNKYFTAEPKTFSIVYDHKNNESIKREELTEKLASLVYLKNEGHKANLKQPELAVLVQIIRGICCLSVVPNYYTLKKYNLLEVISTGESKEGGSETKEKEELEKGKPEVENEKEEEKEEEKVEEKDKESSK